VSKKGTLGTTMTQMSPIPTDTTSASDAPNMCVGAGVVDKIATDIVASPGMGQRRAATGKYESEKRKDTA
jgi:hypothetical protein